MRIVNPADNSLIKELEADTPGSIRKKFLAAREAQPAWAEAPFSERAAALVRFAELLVRDREALAPVLTREMGKPLKQAFAEIDAVGARIRFFIDHAEEVSRGRTVHEGNGIEERLSFEPLGVVGNISAWNYPYFVGSNVFVPALLTGNAVLYKPSEFAALTGQEIERLMDEAGVPPGVFQAVTGEGPAGAALTALDLDGIFFTGSRATGAKIAAAAAKRFVKLQLELGGKDPFYVREDADPRAAAESLADGAFYNTGQSCCSVERIYAHSSVYDDFMESFLKAVRGFKVGDPMEDGTTIGPLARAAQIPILEAQVADAVSKGAELLAGGRRIPGPGNYFEPAVLARATHAMSLMTEESFGPIIGIREVGSDDEAVELMRDNEFGLTAGVYSKNRAAAESILSRIDCGTAYWNCCDRVSANLPWSGRRRSGMGSTLGTIGLASFLKPKAWHLRSPSV